MSQQHNPDRRDFLQQMASAGLILPVAGMQSQRKNPPWPPGPRMEPAPPNTPKPKGVVARIAHITDVHINGDKGSDKAMAKCFAHIQELKPSVDFILNTGDTVMCINGADKADAARQWKAWTSVVEANNRLPMLSIIGNHDSWGWEPATVSDPMRGKQWCMDVLKMPARFYRVERAGWSFVMLDSIFGSYTGKLDDEQAEWLKAEMAKIPVDQPVCICSHIPIITACGFFDGSRFGEHGWTIPGSWMHEDAAFFKDLFLKHPNIKLCLSGHMHQVDRIDFHGVSYLCGGAVSASWWGGKYYECDYGYTLLDLNADGTFRHEYVGYGWQTDRGA